MASRIDPRFRKLSIKVPKRVRDSAIAAYRLWTTNHQHPTLQFKNVNVRLNIWSVRCGVIDNTHYRALGVRKDNDRIVWFWIGSHGEYDYLLDRLQKTIVSNAPKA